MKSLNEFFGFQALSTMPQDVEVTPDDIKAIGKDILRHRIILTYEAEAEQISQEDLVNRLFDEIEVP